jgi:hypothetical protein
MGLNLVTVCGQHTKTLKHMLNHYKDIVDDIFIIVYKEGKDDVIEQEIRKIINDVGCDVHETIVSSPFNWNVVTSLYNKTKRLKPDDWWIVADDDEFQIYHKPINNIIEECEEGGYKFVTGGFLDRVGEDGSFPEIKDDSDIWEQFPLAGFFRYPISNACPNKVTLMKGDIDVSPGQHYTIIDGIITWGEWGWKHPLRYPIDNGFVQVHHFKWDASIINRLFEVSQIKEDYTFHWEYQRMYDYIVNNDNKIDITNKNFMIEKSLKVDYWDYPHWEKVKDIIINI